MNIFINDLINIDIFQNCFYIDISYRYFKHPYCRVILQSLLSASQSLEWVISEGAHLWQQLTLTSGLSLLQHKTKDNSRDEILIWLRNAFALLTGNDLSINDFPRRSFLDVIRSWGSCGVSLPGIQNSWKSESLQFNLIMSQWDSDGLNLCQAAHIWRPPAVKIFVK